VLDETIQISDEFCEREALQIMCALRAKRGSAVLVDCVLVRTWPVARIASLADLLKRFDRWNIAWSLNSVPEEVQTALEFFMYRKPLRRRVQNEQEMALVDQTLSTTVLIGRTVVNLLMLLEDVVYWTVVGPLQRHGFRYSRTLYEITERGVNSLPIVGLVAGIMGLILAMQADAQLRHFGASILIANLVGVSLVYELGPLLAAVLMAGRSGSAITAEIASMVSTEEMDALRAMGVSVTKYVVVPKFVALIITLPCLTVVADLVGIAGGYAFAVGYLGLPSAEYIAQTIQAVSVTDVTIGLVKSAADAVVIATICVHEGMRTHGGSEGIGRSTTQSVVRSIVMIAVAHLFFTALFYLTGHTASFKV
jgi:phospholipid/cholesterol/gamma-HCH transport system permease protein